MPIRFLFILFHKRPVIFCCTQNCVRFVVHLSIKKMAGLKDAPESYKSHITIQKNAGIIKLYPSKIIYISLFAQVQKNKKTQQTDRQTDRHRDRQGVYSYRKQSKQSLNGMHLNATEWIENDDRNTAWHD